MRKVIKDGSRRHTCDTSVAKRVDSRSFGNYGDPAGYEETLYRNRRGYLFVYGVGGPASPYPTETIVSVRDASSGSWGGES